MILQFLKRASCLVLALGCTAVAAAAEPLSENDTREIVTTLADRLVESYPFPEISAKYQQALLEHEKAGKYKELTEEALATQLTGDLRAIHKDVHLAVIFRQRPREGDAPRGNRNRNRGGGQEGEQRRSRHQGFKSVQLDTETSTAYLDIPGPFEANDASFEAASAAMTLAAHSKYVILDIRQNPGGTGHMGRFIASYFYAAGDEKFYLNGFHKDRSMDDQEWTYSFVPGRRNPDAKVYILVGPGTASASEGLAYALQKLGRATIVGNTTAGAGIAGSFVPLKHSLMAFIPVKMVVGPRSTEGWEGTGVIPDVPAGGEDALEVARKAIEEDRKKQ